MSIMDYPCVLTVNEAMEVLRIGRSQCYELLHSGKLKGFKTGKKTWKIARDSLEDYIKSAIKY